MAAPAQPPHSCKYSLTKLLANGCNVHLQVVTASDLSGFLQHLSPFLKLPTPFLLGTCCFLYMLSSYSCPQSLYNSSFASFFSISPLGNYIYYLKMSFVRLEGCRRKKKQFKEKQRITKSRYRCCLSSNDNVAISPPLFLRDQSWKYWWCKDSRASSFFK